MACGQALWGRPSSPFRHVWDLYPEALALPSPGDQGGPVWLLPADPHPWEN